MADTSLSEILFEYFAGDDLVIPIELLDADGNSISIDALAELYAWVKKEGGDVVKKFAKTPGEGEAALLKLDANTYIMVIPSSETKDYDGDYELQFNIVETSAQVPDTKLNAQAKRKVIRITDIDIKTKS